MAKYRFVLKPSVETDGKDLLEEVVECDMVQLSQTDKFFFCFTTSGVQVPDGAKGQINIGRIVKIFNSKYVIEVEDVSIMKRPMLE